MKTNQEKTICCRVDDNMHEVLHAITQFKGVKMSTFIREVLDNAVTTELRRMNIISGAQVTEALKEQYQTTQEDPSTQQETEQ